MLNTVEFLDRTSFSLKLIIDFLLNPNQYFGTQTGDRTGKVAESRFDWFNSSSLILFIYLLFLKIKDNK